MTTEQRDFAIFVAGEDFDRSNEDHMKALDLMFQCAGNSVDSCVEVGMVLSNILKIKKPSSLEMYLPKQYPEPLLYKLAELLERAHFVDKYKADMVVKTEQAQLLLGKARRACLLIHRVLTAENIVQPLPPLDRIKWLDSKVQLCQKAGIANDAFQMKEFLLAVDLTLEAIPQAQCIGKAVFEAWDLCEGAHAGTSNSSKREQDSGVEFGRLVRIDRLSRMPDDVPNPPQFLKNLRKLKTKNPWDGEGLDLNNLEERIPIEL